LASFWPRLSAFHEGIAALGQRAGAKVRRHQQRVIVHPGDAVLAFRQAEAVLNELLLDRIKLADDNRILPAIRQADEAASFFRLQAIRALEDPVFLLALGQRIYIQDRLPFRLLGLVALQRRAPPEAPHLLRVLPEIVDSIAAELRFRRAVLRSEDGQRLLAEGFVARVAFQHGVGLGVLLLHPVKRLLAVHIFQPEEFIRRLDGVRREILGHVGRRGSGWRGLRDSRGLLRRCFCSRLRLLFRRGGARCERNRQRGHGKA